MYICYSIIISFSNLLSINLFKNFANLLDLDFQISNLLNYEMKCVG